ncbi:hypothetical protein BDZ94DRAFT_1282304 [Collybia nuda]|uniref:Nucleoporin Nup159/Nup146 N-terminal domain-containing protein n=1 Tax=Collybia nuda TaxID=64659 RepID=A0A9P5Y808_9AGAR|nr:hypothetical protein BDZ94DRAFT_1282304 [Collybia nuda]
MNDFTRLTRPEQSQVKIDPTPKECLADGFNYPSFRLLNKQGRVKLSPKAFDIQPTTSYRLLAVANSRGWFSAVVDSTLIFSPLDDLRSTLKTAKEGNEETFSPKRRISTPGKATLIVLACNDTRLFVGLEQGQLLVYDTTTLFSPGSENVTPLHAINAQSGPIIQILPNPGTETGLVEMVAVVRGDGTVQLVNMELEPQGGWVGSDADSAPVAVACGDIMTFATTNKTTSHKHIPPTAVPPLVSLNWLSPGHTFRTSYAPAASSTATYFAPTHPFSTPDRLTQQAFTLPLPKWDEDNSSAESKNLLIVGDKSSVDIEILGSVGSQWYQHLPLDDSMEDTVLLSLEVDLTDFTTNSSTGAREPGAPGWYIDHSKPYLGMVTESSPVPASALSQTSTFGTASPPPTSAFGQASAFGQQRFGKQPSTSAFGQPSTFGASSFGQQPASVFDQASTTSAFGQTTSPTAFGSTNQASAFGAPSAIPSPFGQPQSGSAFGQASQPTSAFGSAKPAATSAFGGGNSAFGSGSSGAFGTPATGAFGGGASAGGFGAFSGTSNTTSAFGQTGFGFGTPSASSTPPAPSTASPPSAPDISREASMSDSAPSFGGLSFGLGESNDGPSKSNKPGIFGTLSPPPTATAASSAFGGTMKPAAGFGAFSNLQTTQTPAISNEPAKLSTAPSSAFGSTTSTPSAFSQSSFGQSSFGKPAFGQSAFGQSSFGKPAVPVTTTPTTGGFGAFASAAPTAFGGATTSIPSSGGFGSFAATAKPSDTSAPSASPFSASTPEKSKSAFGGGSTFGGGSAFGGGTPSGGSAFVTQNSTPKTPVPIPSSPSPSPDSSPRPKPSIVSDSESPPHPSLFGQKSTSSGTAFKPATGFGAFGSDTTPTTSPFFKAAETKTPPPVSVFSKPATPTTPTPSAPSATSALGGVKSAFTPASPSPAPTKTPTSGGGFGAFAGPKKSFDPVKPTASPPGATPSAEVDKEKTKPPVSVFTSAPTTPAKDQAKDESVNEAKTPISVFPSAKKEAPSSPTEKPITLSGEPSFGSLSQTSDTGGGSKSGSSDGSLSSDEDDADGDYQPPPEDEESDSDGQSFLSSGKYPGEHSEDGSSPEPTTIPLPPSRSPSATPQPEIPNIHISPSSTPSDSPGPSSPSGLPTIKEESTTPPGTPVKESPSYFGKTTPPPQPSASPTASTPFGLGLGRPSTRPTRSSPLANEEESSNSKSTSELPQKPPVSPRPRFTVLPMPPDSPTKPEAEKPKEPVLKPTTRPLTPPLSASMAVPSPIAPSSTLNSLFATPSATTVPPPVPPAPTFNSFFGGMQPPSLFGTPQGNNSKAATSPAPTSAPPSTPNIFGPNKAFGSTTPPVTPPTPPRFSFGNNPSPGTSATPGTPAGTGFGLGPFGYKGAPASLFGPPTPPSGAPTPPLFPSKPAAPPELTMEEGMQKECALLVVGLDRELEDLRLLAQEASRRRAELGKSAGGSRHKADLGDVTKWGLADTAQFGQVLQQYQQDLETLKELREKQSHALRSLQSNMLKAGTRREEISRFNKAKDDNEFAKMLKARTLGPEHLETQTQLRRNIRAMRDRIEKLEEHLKTSKKKLSQLNSGKPGLRAPSLDTINRTYRNIDLAIHHQSDEVHKLSIRISKLNLSSSQALTTTNTRTTRDPRLPDPISRRPYNVTPHVAITTAAALNAERSAHKLKRALLSVRKEPLLNVRAATAPAPPAAFNTPQKALPGFGVGFATPPGPLFPKTPEVVNTPNWTLPEDNFHPSTPPSGRRGAGAVKKHQSVPLKRTPGGTASPTAPPTFNWGPLPTFDKAPATSMVEAIKLTPPSKPAAAQAPAPPQPSAFFGFGRKA